LPTVISCSACYAKARAWPPRSWPTRASTSTSSGPKSKGNSRPNRRLESFGHTSGLVNRRRSGCPDADRSRGRACPGSARADAAWDEAGVYSSSARQCECDCSASRLRLSSCRRAHNEVTDREERGKPAAARDDDFEQQARRVIRRHEHVGHDRAHDPSSEVLLRLDGQDAPERPRSGGREVLPGSRLLRVAQLLRRPTPKVVDPVVGVRREPDLPYPLSAVT